MSVNNPIEANKIIAEGMGFVWDNLSENDFLFYCPKTNLREMKRYHYFLDELILPWRKLDLEFKIERLAPHGNYEMTFYKKGSHSELVRYSGVDIQATAVIATARAYIIRGGQMRSIPDLEELMDINTCFTEDDIQSVLSVGSLFYLWLKDGRKVSLVADHLTKYQMNIIMQHLSKSDDEVISEN